MPCFASSPTLSDGRSPFVGAPGVRRPSRARCDAGLHHRRRCAAGARRVPRYLLFATAVAAGAGGARAQAPPLVTDRPDRTESAAVVPRGLFQVETGYLFTRDGGVDGHAAPGTLLRIGLGGRTELRLGHAGIAGGESGRGAGDSEVGAKVDLVKVGAKVEPRLARGRRADRVRAPRRPVAADRRPRVLERRRRPDLPGRVRPRAPAGTVAGLQRRGGVAIVGRSDGPRRVHRVLAGPRRRPDGPPGDVRRGLRRPAGRRRDGVQRVRGRRTDAAADRRPPVGPLRRTRAAGFGRRSVRRRGTQLSMAAIVPGGSGARRRRKRWPR